VPRGGAAVKVPELAQVQRILIVGMARSGTAAARAARLMLPQAQVVICDRQQQPPAAAEAGELTAAGIQVEMGREDHTLLDGCGLLVKSPGVPGDISLIEEAHQRGIPVWGEVEFAWRFLDNPLIGVTGTNGKTTTTELIGHILRKAGCACHVAGNVGAPISALVGKAAADEMIVAELSSFQIEDSILLRPEVAVLLNLAEDHLDRYRDAPAYYAAKMLVFSNQQPDDLAVLNADDALVRDRAVPGAGGRAWFSRSRPARAAQEGGVAPVVYYRGGDICFDEARLIAVSAGVRSRLGGCTTAGRTGQGRNGAGGGEDSQKVIAWAEASLMGEHNLENALAAVAVCLGIGLGPEEVAAGLGSFPGVPHRLQQAGMVGGVRYVNDSKATNVDAAIKALTAFGGGVHMILGGSLKGCSFEHLAQAAAGREGKVRAVYLIGEAAGQMEESFRQAGGEVVMAGDLETAFREASAAAAPGEVVLLSPACASFDQFRDYEERGERFLSLVEELRRDSD
jgi:UDP-N-acetylmuramoylalanine--D-glutamate ligase